MRGTIHIIDEEWKNELVFSSEQDWELIERTRGSRTIVTKAILNVWNRTLKILHEDEKSFSEWYLNDRTRPTLLHGFQASALFALFSWLLIRSRNQLSRTLKEVSYASLELETVKRQYITLFREAGVPMLLVDPDTGNIVDANNQACDFYGFSPSTFMDYPVSRFSWDENESVVQMLRLSHVGNEGVKEFKHKMLDGSIKDVHISTTFIEHNWRIHILAVIQDVTQRNRALEEKLHNLNHDALTWLPNRRLLVDRLSIAIATAERNKQKLGVLFIDLDNFKNVNDSQGHAVGDLLLKQASLRMKKLLRSCDTLARQGGDEFIVLLPNINSDEDLELVASKLIQEIEKPFG